MSAPWVTVMGSFVADLAFRTDKLPAWGETFMGNSFRLGPGGKGSNQAVAATDIQSLERPHEGLARDLRENGERLESLLGSPRQPLSEGEALVFLKFGSASQAWKRSAG